MFIMPLARRCRSIRQRERELGDRNLSRRLLQRLEMKIPCPGRVRQARSTPGSAPVMHGNRAGRQVEPCNQTDRYVAPPAHLLLRQFALSACGHAGFSRVWPDRVESEWHILPRLPPIEKTP